MVRTKGKRASVIEDEFDDMGPDDGDDEFEDDTFTSPHEDEIEQLCREALSLVDEGESDAARRAASEAVALDDRHPFPYFVLGVIAEHEGDLPTARYLADQALTRAATNADAISFRAQIHLREYEFGKAEQLLRLGIAHNPEDPDLHDMLARVCLAMGKPAEAAESAGAALRLDPSDASAHAVRIAALEQTGDPEAVLAVLRQAAQLHPDDPYAMIELAQVEAEQGNVDRARMLLGRAQRLAPRDNEIMQARSIIESGNDHLLLRPLPRMTKWLAEFPGGLVGFVVGLLIAAMPMRELVRQDGAYVVPIALLLGIWTFAALYMWIAPAVLRVVLSRAAAMVAATDRITIDEPERTLDAVILCFAGQRPALGLDVLARAAKASEEPVMSELWNLHDALASRPRRVLYALTRIPGQVRVFVSIALGLLVVGPGIAGTDTRALVVWQVAAIVPLALAYFQYRFEVATHSKIARGLAVANVMAEESRRAA